MIRVQVAVFIVAILGLAGGAHAQSCPAAGLIPAGMDCVAAGANKDITAHSTCSKITNSHSSGKAIMVPAFDPSEWSDFRTKLPGGVTLGACGAATYAQPDVGITPAGIIYMNGFESGVVAEALSAPTTFTSSITESVQGLEVRSGSRALSRALSSSDADSTIATFTGVNTLFARFGFKRNFATGIPGGTAMYELMAFKNASNGDVVEIFPEYQVGTTQAKMCYRLLGAGGIPCSASTFDASIWNLIEVKIGVSSTTGSLEIRVNGTIFTTANNLNTGTNAVAGWTIRTGTEVGNTAYFDDLMLRSDGYQGEGGIIMRTVSTATPTYNQWSSNPSDPHPWYRVMSTSSGFLVSTGANTSQTARVDSFLAKPEGENIGAALVRADFYAGSISGSAPRGNGGVDEEVGQSFTPSANITAGGVQLYLMGFTTADGLIAEIRSGSITGTVLASGSKISSYVGGVQTIHFTSPVSLTAGTTYYLRVSRPNTYAINQTSVGFSTTNIFEGVFHIKNNGTWSTDSAKDLHFNLVAPQTVLTSSSIVNGCKVTLSAMQSSGSARTFLTRALVGGSDFQTNITSLTNTSTILYPSSGAFAATANNLATAEIGAIKSGIAAGRELNVYRAIMTCDVIPSP